MDFKQNSNFKFNSNNFCKILHNYWVIFFVCLSVHYLIKTFLLELKMERKKLIKHNKLNRIHLNKLPSNTLPKILKIVLTSVNIIEWFYL